MMNGMIGCIWTKLLCVFEAVVSWWCHQLQRWAFLAAFITCSLWHNSCPVATWFQWTESCLTGL